MKNKAYSLITAFLLSIAVLCACSADSGDTAGTANAAADAVGPNLSQIKEICELATLECYYHNVAKSVKESGSGLLHIGEKDRDFWIEYSGCAKFGIDVSKVTMVLNGNQLTITLPPARLLGMSDYTFSEDSFISSDDGFNKNPITADDQTRAVAEANQQLEEMFSRDEAMLIRAQDRAKLLIESYIKKISELTQTEYVIQWELEDNTPADSPSQP